MEHIQRWAALFFFALAIAAGTLAKVDFHSLGSILEALGVIGAGLGGLCLHPPWAQDTAPTVAVVSPAPTTIVAPRGE